MLERRAAIDEVGLLDEDFFLFSEETDWCYRFEQAGWRVLFTPAAEFVHVYGAVHGGRMFKESVRGHLRFLAKHRGLRAAERARFVLAAGCLLRVPRDKQYAGIARWLLSARVPELLRSS
jgi:GT2 family glycosyltransferase